MSALRSRHDPVAFSFTGAAFAACRGVSELLTVPALPAPLPLFGAPTSAVKTCRCAAWISACPALALGRQGLVASIAFAPA